MSTATLSPDSQVILLLCSRLALPRADDGPKPLSQSEWNDVARSIDASSFRRPGALLGATASSIASELGVSAALSERMTALLSRGGQLAIELERLRALGIWALTRVEADYPLRLKERLKGQAPAVIFGAGPTEPLNDRGIAVVGSRDVDPQGSAFASRLGEACARSGVTVFSGGARGVDKLAVEGALEHGGHALAVLADSLQESLRRKELRDAVLAGRLTLITALAPSTRFTVAAAMGRNKLIYALSSAAVVVASALDSGGTWAGATENLRAGWVPLFVRDGSDVPAGNRELIARGGRPITPEQVSSAVDIVFGRITDADLVRESSPPYDGELDQAGISAGDTPEEVEPSDVFPLVWPRLAEFLTQPRTDREVAQTFHLEKAQAKAWLQRAVDQGLARKLKNPLRFERIIQRDDSQASLFGL